MIQIQLTGHAQLKLYLAAYKKNSFYSTDESVVFGNAKVFFSPELQQGRTVELSGPQRGTAVPQRPGTERPGNQKRSHNSEKVSPQEFSLAHNHYDDGKVSKILL